MIDLYYWTTPNGHKITIFLRRLRSPTGSCQSISLKHARPCEEKRSAPSAVPCWTSFIHPVSGVTPRFRVNHAVSARDDCL
jgi:hypothetical protein